MKPKTNNTYKYLTQLDILMQLQALKFMRNVILQGITGKVFSRHSSVVVDKCASPTGTTSEYYESFLRRMS